MTQYIALLNFTEQGIRAIKDTSKRAKAFRDLAHGMGVVVNSVHWTLGLYDLVIIMEAPSSETMASLMMKLGSLGNVKSQTLHAFSEADIDSILLKI